MREWIRRFRPPVVRQLEASDCGPAALLTVLRFWGGDAALPVVRRLARTNATGTTLLGLRDAARALGMSANGATGSLEQLAQERLPCIAHLVGADGLVHFAVVTRIVGDRVWLVDPAHGRLLLKGPEFEKLWVTKAVLLLQPTGDLRREHAVGWARWLLRYVRKEPGWLLQSVFLGVVASGVGLSTALFIRWLVDRFIPRGDLAMVVATGGALLFLLLLRSLANYTRHRFLLDLGRSVASRVHGDFLAHLFRLPLDFFESRSAGDLTTRVSDGLRLQKGFFDLSGTVVIDGLMVVGSLVFLLFVAPPFALFALAVFPLYLAFLIGAARRLRENQTAVLSGFARAEAHYIDALRGVAAVQGFGSARFFAGVGAVRFDRFLDRSERLGRTHANLGLASELTSGLLLVGSLTVGSLLVIENRLMLGEMMAGYSLLLGSAPAVERLVGAFSSLQESSVAARRFRDVLLTPAQDRAGRSAALISKGLALEEVVLDWPDGTRQFDRLSLEIPTGRITGLCGPSGSGKTTLTRLLNRSCSPTEGAVLADGHPIEHLALRGYRRQVAVFHSSTYLFDATLAENVLLGRHSNGPEAALEGLEGGLVTALLERVPGGWDAPIGETGRRLSDGERQLVGLMRALVDRPSVLLVDEGIAGTDPALAAAILHALVRYGREHAVLLISHDPRVLRNACHVAVLGEGRIVAQGSPADVLSGAGPPAAVPLGVASGSCARW